MKTKSFIFHFSHLLRAAMVALGLVFLCGACSSPTHTADFKKEAYELNKPVPVTNSRADNRPDWVGRSMFQENGKLYFSGGFMEGSDYAVTVRCAYAEALKNVSQSISQFIRSEFTTYAHGSNKGPEGVNRYFEDGVAVLVDTLHIQGVKQTDVFYEEVFLPASMASAYNVFVLLEIRESDYLMAKVAALEKLRDKFEDSGNAEAKKKAEELLEELKKGI